MSKLIYHPCFTRAAPCAPCDLHPVEARGARLCGRCELPVSKLRAGPDQRGDSPGRHPRQAGAAGAQFRAACREQHITAVKIVACRDHIFARAALRPSLPRHGKPSAASLLRARAGPVLALLLAALTAPLPAQAQHLPDYCLPLIPPHLPGDAQLVREFEALLRAEFEQYLSQVSQYFRCLDAERARALQEAAQVTVQYGAFLDALRRAPP